jgi:hypothetical protein
MMRKGSLRGPDFLVIGAQRAGTTWLHRVLQQHPALWLPPVKELHYFDKLKRKRTWLDPHERRRVRPKTIDLWHLSYLLGRRTDRWYAWLFHKAQARGLFAGEVTPTYAVLEEEVFRRIHRMNSDIKLAFVMRDPVDRVWSEVNNALMKGVLRGTLTLDKALGFAHRPGIASSSNYLDTIERLEAVFPETQLYFCFFEALRDRPATFAGEMLSFLGVDQSWGVDLQLPRPSTLPRANRRFHPSLRARWRRNFFLWCDNYVIASKGRRTGGERATRRCLKRARVRPVSSPRARTVAGGGRLSSTQGDFASGTRSCSWLCRKA